MDLTDALYYTLLVGLVTFLVGLAIFGYTLYTGSQSLKYAIGRRVLRKRKQKLYPRCHYYETEEGEKYGLKYPKHEWDLELPGKPSDEISFFACNPGGNYLYVRIHKKPATRHQAEVEVFLRCADGNSYQLPSSPDTRSFWSQDNVFSAAGLTLQCLEPMRKWRIHYNGLMQKISSDGSINSKDKEGVYVKFSLLWFLNSLPFDYQKDNDPDLSARALKSSSWLNFGNATKRLLEAEDFYDQWGSYTGILKVGDTEEEKEIYLWGLKEKRLPQREMIKFQQLHVYTKEGLFFKIGTAGYKNGISKHEYGHVVLPNRMIHPIKDFSPSFMKKKEGEFKADGETYKFKFEIVGKKTINHGDRLELEVEQWFVKVTVNEEEGWGILQNAKECFPVEEISKELHLEKNVPVSDSSPLVVDIDDMQCKSSALVGGKALSLHFLNEMSTKNQFIVPKAFVVTAAAYNRHLKENPKLSSSLNELAKHLCEPDPNKLKIWCDKTVATFRETPMSDDLKEEIQRKFLSHFSSKVKLSVRSSAVGEDSIETSAAGQNDTYLGVNGFQEVCQAICNCWGSQFTVIAIQYKRQNGQWMDSGMGVVVQEMVDSEVAGVIFTCDPLNGNPHFINISANYGLGETVVDGSVEPDNIVVKRNLAEELSVKSYTIGNKEKSIKLRSDGGTTEETLSKDSKRCLTDEQALKLAKIAVKIEDAFNSLRDIEWAINAKDIYMLQARPVTTHLKWSEFEMIHEFDTGVATDHECISSLHTGEVMPFPACPLTLSYFDLLNVIIQRIGAFMIRKDFHPQFRTALLNHRYRMLFNLIDTVPPADPNNKTLTGRFWELSMAGRLLDEYEDLQVIIQRRHGPGTSTAFRKFVYPIFKGAILLSRNIRKAREEIFKTTYPGKYEKTSHAIIDAILNFGTETYSKIFKNHFTASMLSSVINVMILDVLTKDSSGTEFTNEIASDLAVVLSGVGNVESGDVPALLQQLSSTVCSHLNKEEFASLDPKLALKQLQEDQGPAGKKFREFLELHGHRCVQEFDLKSVPWGMDPMKLVSTLQAMTRNPAQVRTKSSLFTAEEAIQKLKNPPKDLKSRLKLKLLITLARFAIQSREKTKSCNIKMVSIYRQAYLHLGEVMAAEIRIPDKDLIFYLAQNEIFQLLETRSADLVAKAKRRRRLIPTLYKDRFQDVYVGIPVKLKSESDENYHHLCNSSGSVELKGTPVCQGVVKGTVKVVMRVEDAGCVQAGDILITPRTDIGWSPYFPLLAGLVTEAGGLISHGAVVAREYGLPCIVGVPAATRVFKSGDEVIMDANNGVLKKISSES